MEEELDVDEEQEEVGPLGAFSHTLYSVAQEMGDSSASIREKKPLFLLFRRF